MEYRPIMDFPGYEVSADGHVRSWRGRGKTLYVKKPHDVTPVWLKAGSRWAVRLNKDEVRHLRCIANLVLEAFVGPPPSRGVGSMNNLADVMFLDGDSSNVCLSNLAWRTE